MFENSNKNGKILEVLKENSRLSSGKISKKTGIPATTIFNRIKKMEKEGIIKKYTVDLDYKKIGIGIQAFVFVSQDYKAFDREKQEKMLDRIAKEPGIDNVFRISGRYDLLIIFRAKDIDELDEFLIKLQEENYGILKTETMVVLKSGTK